MDQHRASGFRGPTGHEVTDMNGAARPDYRSRALAANQPGETMSVQETSRLDGDLHLPVQTSCGLLVRGCSTLEKGYAPLQVNNLSSVILRGEGTSRWSRQQAAGAR